MAKRLTAPPSSICLLLSTDDDDHYVVYGHIVREDPGDIFVGHAGARISMKPEWLSRAQPITDELREIYGEGPSHYIQLSVESIPEGDDLKSFSPTGLKLSPDA